MPELYHPVLDCFMRALPFHYRSMRPPPGTALRIHVSGDCGGDWHLYCDDAWMLASEPAGTIVATVTIPQDVAWRIFTKGIARENAREHVRVTGDAVLGYPRPRDARNCGVSPSTTDANALSARKLSAGG